jgi:hypothetical protein
MREGGFVSVVAGPWFEIVLLRSGPWILRLVSLALWCVVEELGMTLVGLVVARMATLRRVREAVACYSVGERCRWKNEMCSAKA